MIVGEPFSKTNGHARYWLDLSSGRFTYLNNLDKDSWSYFAFEENANIIIEQKTGE